MFSLRKGFGIALTFFSVLTADMSKTTPCSTSVVLAFSDGRALTIGETKHDAMGPLEEAFGSGALHPADLKPAVNKAVEAVLDKVRKGVAADAELAKAQKEMEKVHKRMTAKK